MASDIVINESVEQARIPVTVLHVKGEINTNTFDQLQARADQAYASGTRDVLLDLTDVPYISSAGLRALHHIFTMLRANRPEESDEAMSKGLRDGTFKSPHLKLLKPNPRVHEVLKVAGFDMYLEIFNDRKSALASF